MSKKYSGDLDKNISVPKTKIAVGKTSNSTASADIPIMELAPGPKKGQPKETKGK